MKTIKLQKDYLPLGKEYSIELFRGTVLNILEEVGNFYKVQYPNTSKIYFMDKHWFEFELPAKWCVKVTKENVKVLTDWRIHGINISHEQGVYGYLHSNKTWLSDIHFNYTEITFEEFKKYVLKKEELIQPGPNASMDEILEYCKKKYPDGTKYKHSKVANKIYICKHPLYIGSFITKSIKDSVNTNYWLYNLGEYAEIVTDGELQAKSKSYTLEHIKKVIEKHYDKDDAKEIIKTITNENT